MKKNSTSGTKHRKAVRRNPPQVAVRVRYRQGEDGWIVAECPDLPGCLSQGRTVVDARRNIRDAIEGWLLVQRQLGLPRKKRVISELVVVS